MAAPLLPGADAEVARRLHGALNARSPRRGRARPRDEAAAEERGGVEGEVEEEAEKVKIRAVEWWPVVKAEQEEEVKIRAVGMVKDEPEEVKISAVEAGQGRKRRR